MIVDALRGPAPGVTWENSVLTPITTPDAGTTDFSPFLTNDNVLYFARSLTGDFDIARAEPPNANPSVVSELTSPATDSDPALTIDGLTIYFSSTRPTSLDTDIWTATRSTPKAGFSEPKRVEELSSTGADAPGWISPDGCRIYMSSTRNGGGNGPTSSANDLFVASRPKR